MASVSEVTTLPAELGEIINEKKTGKVGAVEGIGESEGSEAAGSVLSGNGKSRQAAAEMLQSRGCHNLED